jgi:hypothetical protein
VRSLLTSTLLASLACSSGCNVFAATVCEVGEDCGEGEVCTDGFCVAGSSSDDDAGAPDEDAGVADAGFDAGHDAGAGDAGYDAGAADAGYDAGDAGYDAGPGDAGPRDAGADGGYDAGAGDAGYDAGVGDAGYDAGPKDAGADGGSDAGADAGLTDGGDSGLPVVDFCPPLPTPSTGVVNWPDVGSTPLHTMVASLSFGETLLIATGDYTVTSPLIPSESGVTVRSASGNAGDVSLDGSSLVEHLVELRHSDLTLAHLTLIGGSNDVLDVAAPSGDTTGTRIYDVTFAAFADEAIQINKGSSYPDNGEIACSNFSGEALDRSAGNCATVNAVRLEGGQGWVLRDNVVENIWCQDDTGMNGTFYVTEGARDTVIERNFFHNVPAAIYVGEQGTYTTRNYGETVCSAMPVKPAHIGGVVRNNVIAATDIALNATAQGLEYGVRVQNACDLSVVHNTVVFTFNPQQASFAFEGADTFGALLSANLATHGFAFESGVVEVTSLANLVPAGATLFVAPGQGDFHLEPTASAVIDQAISLDSAIWDRDLDGQPTYGSAPDIGADEYVP